MTDHSVSPGLAALGRLASRASGQVAVDAVMPRRPSVFELAPGAATEPEESNEERDVRSDWAQRVSPIDAGENRDRSARGIAAARWEPHDLPAQMRMTVPAVAAANAPAAVRPTAVPAMAFPASPEEPGRPRLATPGETRIIHETSRVLEPVSGKSERPLPRVDAATRPISSHERSMPATTASAPPIARPSIVHQPVRAIRPARQPASPERAAMENHVVHVTIGRVEIRASSSPAPKPPKEGRASRSEPGLDAYLRRRALGSRS